MNNEPISKIFDVLKSWESALSRGNNAFGRVVTRVFQKQRCMKNDHFFCWQNLVRSSRMLPKSTIKIQKYWICANPKNVFSIYSTYLSTHQKWTANTKNWCRLLHTTETHWEPRVWTAYHRPPCFMSHPSFAPRSSSMSNSSTRRLFS